MNILNTQSSKTYFSPIILVMSILLFAFQGKVDAKSLYVIGNINLGDAPILAYDIQPPPNYLIYQTTTNIPYRGIGAVGITIDTDSKVLFVTYEDSDTIEILDATTMASLGNTVAPAASNLAGILVDQGKKLVYTVDRDTGNLYIYRWNTISQTLTLDHVEPLANITAAHGISLDEINGLLFVADRQSNIVRYFRTSDWTEAGNFTITQAPAGIAVDVVKRFVYTGNPQDTYGGMYLLSKFNLNTGIETTIDIRMLTGVYPDNVVGLAVDQATNLLYITTGDQWGEGSDRLMVFDSDLNLLYQTGDIGNPTGLCIPGRQVSYNPLNLAKNGIIVGSGVSIGSQFKYEITCDNSSNPIQAATNVMLTDNLPTELDFVSANYGGIYQTGTHTALWNIGTIPAGSVGPKIELVVKVNSNAQSGSTIYNYCTISADGIPPTTVIDQDPCNPSDEPGIPIVEGTVSVTVNAPSQVEMGSKYYVDVDIVPSESWHGGWVNLDVNETRSALQATWDIHDNEYWDTFTNQWEQRPEAYCQASVWDAAQNTWVLTDSKYEFGTDSINLYVPADGTTMCRFKVYHQWYWVPPWDWSRVGLIIVGQLARFVDPSIPIQLLAFKFATALGGQHEISYTYKAQVQENVDSGMTRVTVPPNKYVGMGISLGSSIGASLATIAAFIPGPHSLPCLITEGICIVASEAFYVAASDPPDFNYTEVAVPQVPVISELDQITDANQREAAEKALEFAANALALRKSLERYEGARIDGMPQYMALQMGAARLYAERVRQLATCLRDFWCPISATLPIPTSEQIQQIRQDLIENGLPDLEVAVLSAFGYSGEQMTEIATTTASLPDEWFTSPETICTALERLVEGVSQNLQFVPGPDVNIMVPQTDQIVQGGVTLTAEVNDQNIIDSVYFYIGEPNNNGIPTEYQEFASTFDSNTGLWQHYLDTNQLQNGYYVILAKAIDIYGNEGWSKVVPFRIQNNHPPVANAGPNQTVYAWIDGVAEVNLDGSDSNDPDGDALTYKWSWVIDGNTYEANGVKPSIELPVGQYIISLVVNDGMVDSEPNDVNITVIGAVKANLCVMPKVLNCKSFLPKIMTTILLPKGITKDQIDMDKPLLLYPGEIEAERMWISRDYEYKCRAWRTSILAWFDKDDLMSAIDGNGKVELAVVGQLKSGQYFFGTDDVNVICPGRWPWPWHWPWRDYRWNRWCQGPVNFR